MRRYLLALLAFTAGCKSVPELASEGRWIDACERAWKRGDSERDQLFALQAAALDTEVSLRVYDIDALSALLPYVPAQMATGEAVLVEFSLRGSPAAASRLDVTPTLYSGDDPVYPWDKSTGDGARTVAAMSKAGWFSTGVKMSGGNFRPHGSRPRGSEKNV